MPKYTAEVHWSNFVTMKVSFEADDFDQAYERIEEIRQGDSPESIALSRLMTREMVENPNNEEEVLDVEEGDHGADLATPQDISCIAHIWGDRYCKEGTKPSEIMVGGYVLRVAPDQISLVEKDDCGKVIGQIMVPGAVCTQP